MPTYDCPTCSRVINVAQKEEAPFRPFCSQRCKMVDLGKWFDGTYAVSEPLQPNELTEAGDFKESDSDTREG